MPYLRLTCPSLPAARGRQIAAELTDLLVDLFTPQRGPSQEEMRSRSTVHFTSYNPDELFVGGRAAGPDQPDVTAEISDWSMSRRQQAQVAARPTPVLSSLFDAESDAMNVRSTPTRRATSPSATPY
jgi:phenylpyruvate tautomerase PptA (4-oxalocrotonate tautomerase family)